MTEFEDGAKYRMPNGDVLEASCSDGKLLSFVSPESSVNLLMVTVGVDGFLFESTRYRLDEVVPADPEREFLVALEEMRERLAQIRKENPDLEQPDQDPDESGEWSFNKWARRVDELAVEIGETLRESEVEESAEEVIEGAYCQGLAAGRRAAEKPE